MLGREGQRICSLKNNENVRSYLASAQQLNLRSSHVVVDTRMAVPGQRVKDQQMQGCTVHHHEDAGHPVDPLPK